MRKWGRTKATRQSISQTSLCLAARWLRQKRLLTPPDSPLRSSATAAPAKTKLQQKKSKVAISSWLGLNSDVLHVAITSWALCPALLDIISLHWRCPCVEDKEKLARGLGKVIEQCLVLLLLQSMLVTAEQEKKWLQDYCVQKEFYAWKITANYRAANVFFTKIMVWRRNSNFSNRVLAEASRISNQRQVRQEEIWILALKKQPINFWAKVKNRILKYRSNLSSESKIVGVFSPKHTALLEQLQ